MSARPTLEKLKFNFDKKKNCYSVEAMSAEIKGQVVIPNIHNGITVSAISDYAFSDCQYIKSVVIPDSVLSIGQNSFHNCRSLKTIVLSNSLERIEDWAFSGCSSLNITLIPDSVVLIGEGAFIHCSSIESFTIPRNIISIGTDAFSYCRSLKNIYVDENNEKYLSLDGVLFDKNGHTLLCFPSSYEKEEYIIQDDVLSIGESAFAGCLTLTSIIIPENISSVGKYAFSHCLNLESVTILNSNIIINNGAFYGCSSLALVDLPDSVKSIGFSVFSGCLSLKRVTLPFVGDPVLKNAFLRHVFGISNVYDPKENRMYTGGSIPQSLKALSIGNGYTSVEKWTFSDCFYLASTNIPASITSIDEGVFSGNVSIIVDSNNLYYSSDNGILFNKRKTSLIYCPCACGVSYTIPDTVISICNYAFAGCSSLKSLTIPSNVVSIGMNAFSNCTSLDKIIFKGTKEQWNSLSKGDDWNHLVLATTIHCSDGDAAL